jgi:hypothetical protein
LPENKQVRDAMKKIHIMMLVACLISPLGWADDKQQAAEKAAAQWLSLLDQKEYAQTWQDASVIIRQQVKVNDWVQSFSQLHQQFGRMQSRRLQSAHYTSDLPDAPAGEYVVLQYHTVYEKKGPAIETVTPTFEKGQWRVSGYYIK